MVIKLESCKKNASSTGFQLLKFVKLDWFVINVYANPNSFQATLKIIMTGDFNALSYDNIGSSSILKLNDARIKRFAQIKKQILGCFGFNDFALKNGFCDYTHYDKQHKIFAHIDYAFMNFEIDYDSIQSTQIVTFAQLLHSDGA